MMEAQEAERGGKGRHYCLTTSSTTYCQAFPSPEDNNMSIM